ncbi:MAG: Maf family protein [Desulfitobacteriaceae bacterium]
MFVLASSSPRRAMLLSEWGYKPEVIEVNVDETLPPGCDPYEGVGILAARKALAGLKFWQKSGGNEADVVIGADTMVVLERQALGKPKTPYEAELMLESLSGREHLVLTGLALARGDGETVVAVAETKVRFRPLSHDEIRVYVESGEPLDKAGAYGIQGGARKFVESYHGSLSNVIGLPMELLSDKLKAWGIDQTV